jgi:hypothetical protein
MLGDAMGSAEGAQGALSSLYGPLLGPGLGRAYQTQIGSILEGEERNLAEDPDTYTPGKARNFWEYIFQNIAPGSAPQGALPGQTGAAGAEAAAQAAQANGGTAVPPQTASSWQGPVSAMQAPQATGVPAQTASQWQGPTSEMGSAPTATPSGAEVSPEQVEQISAQTGIPRDSIFKILRDLGTAGIQNFVPGGVQNAITGHGVISNPYIQRLLSLAGN